LLGYYSDDGKLIYAGRVGTGMPDKVLGELRRRLEPLARATSPLTTPPPRKTRFGSPLVLSALGRTATCRRDHLSDVDGGRSVAANGGHWAPLRQTGRTSAKGNGAWIVLGAVEVSFQPLTGRK
jgi:hypothetical protein